MAENVEINLKKSIYAKVVVKEGTYFGPYPGKDAVDKRFSEWMSYIGKAKSIDEANLISFPENGYKYYKTTRVIQPLETFLVWDEGFGNGFRVNHHRITPKTSTRSVKRKMETSWNNDEQRITEISDGDSDWIETENSLFACPECGEEYVSLAGLALHRVQHLQDRSCVVCGKIYRREDQLHQHLLSHSSEFCSKCVELFGAEFSLDDKPPFRELRRPLCVDCDSIIIVNNAVSVSSNDKKKRSCGICGKTFATAKTLLSHVNKHNNKYCCKCCKKSFGTYSNLVRHLSTGVHNDDEKKFVCGKCGEKFKWEKTFVEHGCTCGVKEEVVSVNDDKIKEEELRQRCSLRKRSIKKRCCCCLGDEACAENVDKKEKVVVVEEEEEEEEDVKSLSELPKLSRNNSNCEDDGDREMPVLCRYDQDLSREDFEHSPTSSTTKQTDTDVETSTEDLWSNLNSRNLRNRQINLKNGLSSLPSSSSPPTCPTVFICPVCPQVFTSEAGLTLHQLIHSCEEKCCACGLTFNLHVKLQKHLTEHSSDDIWNCFRCQILLGSQFTLEHRPPSTNPRYPLCIKCDELICINTDVKATMTMKSQNCDGFECRHCGVIYTDRKYFNAHLNRHLRKFTCRECNKCFGSYEHLARHVIAHTDYFPYTCETCKKKFKWASDSSHVCAGKKQNGVAEKQVYQNGASQVRHRRSRSVKKKSCFCCSDVVDVSKIKKEKIEDLCEVNGEEIILFTDSANSSCVIEENNKMDVDDDDDDDGGVKVNSTENHHEDDVLTSKYTNYNESVMVECNCVEYDTKTENLIFDCDNNKYFKMEHPTKMAEVKSKTKFVGKSIEISPVKMSLRNHRK